MVVIIGQRRGEIESWSAKIVLLSTSVRGQGTCDWWCARWVLWPEWVGQLKEFLIWKCAWRGIPSPLHFHFTVSLSPSPPVDLQANNNGHSDDNGDTSGSESTVARVTSSEGPLRIRISGIQGKQEDTSAEIDGNGNGGGGASRNKGTSSSSKSSSSSYPDVNAGAFVATTTRRTPRDDDDAAASDPSRYVNRYGEGVICLAVHTNCNNHHNQQQQQQSHQ